MRKCYWFQQVEPLRLDSGTSLYPSATATLWPSDFCSVLPSPPLGTSDSVQPSSTCHWDYSLAGAGGEPGILRPHVCVIRAASPISGVSLTLHRHVIRHPEELHWGRRMQPRIRWNLIPCGEITEQSEEMGESWAYRFLFLLPSTDCSSTFICLACPETSHVCS